MFDRDLVSHFEWLRARPKDEPATEPVYIAFDVLELDGKDLRPLPLRERRRVLERLVYVPVSPPVAQALQGYLLSRGAIDPVKSANEPLLVNSRGKRWTRNAMTDLMARIGEVAGVTRFRVPAHKLRHTGNVVARRGGVDAVVRSALLNHSSTRTVAEYDHLIPSEVYEARLQQREGLARYLGGETSAPRL